jgi:hypothetical protein
MGDYNNDDLEDDDLQEEPVEGEPGNNRNFLLALGILGGVFVLLVIVLLLVFLNRPKPGVPNIAATNAVIEQANAATAVAATQTAGFILTPSITPTFTITPLPSATSVLAIASATPTVGKGEEGTAVAVATEGAIGKNTATVAAALTLAAPTSVAQTQAALGQKTNTPAVVAGKGTATALPTTGFADEVGLPGLFGLALGLVLLIVIVRRLRLSPSR